MPFTPPPHDCPLCPRLVAFREANAAKFPDKHNAPVDPFGPLSASLLIVGLAPGLKGANFSGRPFTGDYAGDLLYATLIKTGRAKGTYQKHRDDGLELIDCRITNAVRCVPPENKPTTEEANTCRPFLIDEIEAMENLHTILSLGLISHNAVLKTFGLKQSAFKFGHGAKHQITEKITLLDSYHCSRYNTQTGRLTAEMFEDVFEMI
ncbi:MAG: uracil-DNA glycosylase [Alphaproteobacteria bacterium]|nr:uracil-DNA glycosylase [Alphaproteobacteria bacterium]